MIENFLLIKFGAPWPWLDSSLEDEGNSETIVFWFLAYVSKHQTNKIIVISIPAYCWSYFYSIIIHKLNNLLWVYPYHLKTLWEISPSLFGLRSSSAIHKLLAFLLNQMIDMFLQFLIWFISLVFLSLFYRKGFMNHQKINFICFWNSLENIK